MHAARVCVWVYVGKCSGELWRRMGMRDDCVGSGCCCDWGVAVVILMIRRAALLAATRIVAMEPTGLRCACVLATANCSAPLGASNFTCTQEIKLIQLPNKQSHRQNYCNDYMFGTPLL